MKYVKYLLLLITCSYFGFLYDLAATGQMMYPVLDFCCFAISLVVTALFFAEEK